MRRRGGGGGGGGGGGVTAKGLLLLTVFSTISPGTTFHVAHLLTNALNFQTPTHHDRQLSPLFSTVDAEVSQGSSLTDSSSNEYSFFDEAVIYVRAGSGGQGASTFKKGAKGQDGAPDGGNGGKGGDVLLELNDSYNTLAGLSNAWRPNSFGGSGAATSTSANRQHKHFRAENGEDGKRQLKSGGQGKDISVQVPSGTIVQEILETENGEESLVDIGVVNAENPSLLVAVGGRGGEGSGVNARGRGFYRPRLSPQGGEKKALKLTLKIVADVALVGIPNAGKSTFLASVTRAKPKIANYPFTTVIPNLGVWVPPELMNDNDGRNKNSGSVGLVLCDVPGLIEGASKGVGLGHAFLRHIERCHVILHLVDATSKDPLGDFQMLNAELVHYGTGQLAHMPQIVVLNKLDLLADDKEWEGSGPKPTREELVEKFLKVMGHTRLLWISAKEGDGVNDLMVRMAAFVKKVKDATSRM